jgi:hypothetical protein
MKSMPDDTSLTHFEESLLTELKEAVARQSAILAGEARAPRNAPNRRRWLAAAAVGLSGALVGGLLATALPHPAGKPGGKPAADYVLADFLDHAAAAARARNASLPAPGQVFYIRETQSLVLDPPSARRHRVPHRDRLRVRHPGPTCSLDWNLTPLTGKHQLLSVGGSTCPVSTVIPAPPASYPTANEKLGALLPYYPPLSSLPTSPASLLATLRADASPDGPYGWQGSTRDQIVYMLIGDLLEAPVSGSLRAALYEAIERLPGVTLVVNATDAAGRHGVGIELKTLGLDRLPWVVEYILTPLTYQFLGELLEGYTDQVQGMTPYYGSVSIAVLSSGLVSGR